MKSQDWDTILYMNRARATDCYGKLGGTRGRFGFYIFSSNAGSRQSERMKGSGYFHYLINLTFLTHSHVTPVNIATIQDQIGGEMR